MNSLTPVELAVQQVTQTLTPDASEDYIVKQCLAHYPWLPLRPLRLAAAAWRQRMAAYDDSNEEGYTLLRRLDEIDRRAHRRIVAAYEAEARRVADRRGVLPRGQGGGAAKRHSYDEWRERLRAVATENDTAALQAVDEALAFCEAHPALYNGLVWAGDLEHLAFTPDVPHYKIRVLVRRAAEALRA